MISIPNTSRAHAALLRGGGKGGGAECIGTQLYIIHNTTRNECTIGCNEKRALYSRLVRSDNYEDCRKITSRYEQK